MNMLAVVMLAIFASAMADNNLNNPPTFPPGAEQCYKCTEFSPQGQGFIEHEDPVYCCWYYECWKTQGATALQGVRRTCPEGTWFNPNYLDPIYGVNVQQHGQKGNPCIAFKPYAVCIDTCPPPPPPPPTYPTPPCPWFPLGSDTQQYGYCNPEPITFPYTQVPGPTCPATSLFTKVNECAAGQTFDYASCTCCGPSKPDLCVVDMILASNILDFSPIKGEIMPSGDPVIFMPVPALPTGAAAVFTGSTGRSKLNDQALSGMYGSCWLKKLSVGVFFNANSVSGLQGVVCYASCDAFTLPPAASYGISIENGRVVANIGVHEVSWPINANQWYYVSFVYVRRKNSLKLYVMSVAQAIACQANPTTCPGPVDQTATGYACVESRPCGLEVGYTGTSANMNEFFDGMISRVQVYHGKNIMACE